MSIDLQTQR